MDRDTLKRVAWLARIAADSQELSAYGDHLDRLREFVDDLKSAPIDGIEPMAHPLDMVQRLRPDVVTESDHRDECQQQAPETVDGLYLVPKVIE
jgi:aspartyl-tRNA(Asn)/glutamyl-tRNA(Gln) amidotransferase subunit C